MNDEVREAFEQWISSNGGGIDRTDGGEYRNGPTECAWVAWVAAESNTTKQLQGEAKVMRDLLRIALGVIENCYPDDSTEAEFMEDLQDKIKAVLEAA